MGRQTGPKCRQCRTEGAKLFLKGSKCLSAKCPFAKRGYAPGMHGQKQRRVSEFRMRLREKQKAKRIFGLSERQFRKYYEMASSVKGSTGDTLMRLLETRLDNVIYKISLAASRSQARQFVNSGHIAVNGKKVDIPSFAVAEGDVITVKEKSQPFVKTVLEKAGERTVPAWLSFDADKMEAKVVAMPKREEMDALIAEHLIVEFYSR